MAAAAVGLRDAHLGAQQAPFGQGRVIVVAGAPASGKGTQCKRLAEAYGFIHLSTGDVFRDIAARGTELGRRAKEYMDKGCFVPDEMVLNLVRERLSQPDVKEHGCLLDGFPRTADQAAALLAQVKVDAVLLLQAPEKVLIRRAADRRIDPDTGDIYHLQYVLPPPEIVDRLVRRERDDEHSFRQRLEVFKGQHRRVLPWFSGLVHKVDATLEPDDVFQVLSRTLHGLFGTQSEATREEEVAGAAMPQRCCAICFDEPADFLVVPCGHQCGCEECLTAVKSHSGRCPVCRGLVQSIQRVFQCGVNSKQTAKGNGGYPAASDTEVMTHADLQDKLDHQAGVLEDDWSEDGDGPQDEQQDGVSLVVAPCSDIPADGGEVNIMISVRVPDAAVRAAADVVCVIDVSGSMGAAATYETSDGEKKDDGLTVLEIVKHAVKTVLMALQEGDRLALVSFNQQAQTILSLTHMDAAGQAKALEALDSLQEAGQTNIWAGILAAMDALREGCTAGGLGRQQAVLLLTDGQPNVVPPRGHVTEMRDYKDKHSGFTFQLNTFGFGYNLDSELLLDLAFEGHGTYAFIPDAVIVGTTFVDSVANVLSTLSQSSTLNLMPRAGAEFAGPVLGGFAELQESWGRAVTFGPMQRGQSRELVVPMRLPPYQEGAALESYLEVVLTYPGSSGHPGRVCADAASRMSCLDAVVAGCRADVVSTGLDAIQSAIKNQGEQASIHISSLSKRLAMAHLRWQLSQELAISSNQEDGGEVDGRLLALSADVDGRMSKALQGKDRFNRWGKHYLRALMRAHQVQLCTNFMDPGLQPYGGKLFRSLREVGDKIFLSLPPPVKKVKACRASAPTAKAPSSPQMNTYYAGAGGGCFAPSSSVELVVRSTGAGCELLEEVRDVPFCHVRAGDHLRVADGGTARVRCVVEVARGPQKSLVTLPQGLQITAQHPVRINGAWCLPKDLPGAVTSPSTEGSVLNVVLDRCHILLVNGVECVTWGHGFQGPIIGHRFFGTARILEELAAFQGWEEGFVRLHGAVRDQSGEVVGFIGPRILAGALVGADRMEATGHCLASNL